MSILVFIKKEIMELYKTPRLIIMGLVFLFFAMISPLTAKFMNELVAMAGQQQGMIIKLPDPVYTDSYFQFFKNLNFAAFLVLILIFSGSVAEEKAKGTVALALTKKLSRTGFILSKLVTAYTFMTVVYAVSAAVCIIYTGLLFPEYSNERLLPGILIYWVYMVMIITVSIFCSSLSKSYMPAAISSIAACITLSLMGSLPGIGKYMPGMLQGLPSAIISGAESVQAGNIPLLGALGVIIGCGAGTLLIFRRIEL